MSDADKRTPIEPQAVLATVPRGYWVAVPPDDKVVSYIAQECWPQNADAEAWEAARMSQTVHLYRETATGWIVVAKFYLPKTGSSAPRHARRELERIERVRNAGLAHGPLRAVRPLGAWRGVLFLEHVPGLALLDLVAVRHSRPGMILSALTQVAGLLAKLHSVSDRPKKEPDVSRAEAKARGYVDQLARHGVLKEEPMVADGLRRLCRQWGERAAMQEFTPALAHGDATATNFILTETHEVVAIDWERLTMDDPAADLGRLLAELSHAVERHGGREEEAEYLLRHLISAYSAACRDDSSTEALIERARFYRASSTLRIARNGWLSRVNRMALVARAMALLIQ
jgi:hypothetical protein